MTPADQRARSGIAFLRDAASRVPVARTDLAGPPPTPARGAAGGKRRKRRAGRAAGGAAARQLSLAETLPAGAVLALRYRPRAACASDPALRFTTGRAMSGRWRCRRQGNWCPAPTPGRPALLKNALSGEDAPPCRPAAAAGRDLFGGAAQRGPDRDHRRTLALMSRVYDADGWCRCRRPARTDLCRQRLAAQR